MGELLEVNDLTIKYRTEKGDLTAVSNANFSVNEEEYVGLIGESGCGKSTVVKALIGGLDANGFIDSGEILFNGESLGDMTQEELNKEIRWKEISYIPQSSMNSLDPLQRISEQATEIASAHTDQPKAETIERLSELFEVVGINPDRMYDYPHQFSGGMEQRAIIALALLLNPSIIIADEPTTALDVIMQDQVMKYLDSIKEELGTSLLLITHDISVVMESCEKQVVMHSGQVCESGATSELFESPRHPYYILLKEAFPDIRFPDRSLEVIEGHPPETIGDVDWCTFANRCPWAVEECHQKPPNLENVDSDSEQHTVACFRKDDVHKDYNKGDVK